MKHCPTKTQRQVPMRASSRSRPLAPPPCTSSPCPTMSSGTCTRTCRSMCRETGSALQVKFPALLSREEGCEMLMLAKLRMSRVNTNMLRGLYFLYVILWVFFHIVTRNTLLFLYMDVRENWLWHGFLKLSTHQNFAFLKVMQLWEVPCSQPCHAIFLLHLKSIYLC